MSERLGVGFTFPFRFETRTGGVSTTEDVIGVGTSPQGEKAVIRMSLEQIVRTAAIGERFMRPEFGANVFDVPFEPGNESLLGLLEYYVAKGIERWEPRVTLLRVDATQDGSKILVTVVYRITNDNLAAAQLETFDFVTG
jgi:hypothetical protein